MSAINPKSFFLERLRACQRLLELVLELTPQRPGIGLHAIFQRIRDLLPMDIARPLNDFPRQKFAGVENRLANFHAALGSVANRANEEIEATLQESHDRGYFDLDVRLDMYLNDSDVAAKEDADNLLLSQSLPWNQLFAGAWNPGLCCRKSRGKAVCEYLLQSALPRISKLDFLRVDSIWADIYVRKISGFKLWDRASKYERLDNSAIAELYDYEPVTNTRDISKFPAIAESRTVKLIQYINKLLALIKKLQIAYANDSPDCDNAFFEFYGLLDNMSLDSLFDHGDFYLNLGKNDKRNDIDDWQYNSMKCLDTLMRDIERDTSNFIATYEPIFEKSIIGKPRQFSDYELPFKSVLVFWTKKENYPFTIPFWKMSDPSISFFNDREDWHETHFYKPMCYLSHAAFVDGGFHHSELDNIDFVTWEFIYAKQILANINLNSQEISGSFPAQFP